MSTNKWIGLIVITKKLIASGMSRAQAIASVASIFSVSEIDICRRGGFKI